MNEPLGTLARTHTCGALRRPTSARTSCCSAGCIACATSARCVFLDMRDRHGLTQVMVARRRRAARRAKRLRSEFVVAVLGQVERRAAETVNPKLATGEVEVARRRFALLNEAKTPPFPIADEIARLRGDAAAATATSICGGRACSTTSVCATASRWRCGSTSTSRASRDRDADPDEVDARRARATTSCRAACIRASSTRCRSRRRSSSRS